jgi:Flp pilus assembly protein TadG
MKWMNPKRFLARGRMRRGNAVLDAALVFPILLSLTFGTVEFGYYFYVKHTLQGAAREGCRAGITPTGQDSDVKDAILNSLKAAGLLPANATVIDPTKFTVKIESPFGTTISAASLSTGSTLFVTVQGQWGVLGSGFRPLALIGSNKTVVGTTAMRREG